MASADRTVLTESDITTPGPLKAALDSAGGGGAVSSVNGSTGDVVLSAADIGASPAEHDHAMDDVTGLTAQLSGTVNFGGFPLTFGPEGQLTVGGVLQTTYSELQNRPLSTEVVYYVRVVTGNEPRPERASMVFWIGGTTEPVNMETGDVWMAAD